MMLPFFVPLPLEVGKFTITAAYNFWIIVGSGVLTVALLWWAKRTTY
jgi:hypothetical protein